MDVSSNTNRTPYTWLIVALTLLRPYLQRYCEEYNTDTRPLGREIAVLSPTVERLESKTIGCK